MAAAKRLTARQVETIKTPGRHADGGNLYLNVTASGARSWIFMWARAGRQREMGLGPARDVSLVEARELASTHRRAILAGHDPLELRKATVTKPTFGAYAEEHVASMEAGWRNPKHRAQWRSTLATYAAPLKSLPVDQVATADILAVLKPIWSAKPETASRVRGRIEAVLDAAKAAGLRSGDNPAAWRGHLDNLLPKRSSLSRGHHAAMPIDETPAFVERLRKAEGVSARALEFTILTAARSGEALGAQWPEIDLERRVWTVPATRMKGGREHRVPLCDRAVEILEASAAVRSSAFVFSGSKRDAPLSNMAIAMTLRRLDQGDVTAHGFRSTFRDWIGERTSFPGDVAEMALAHAVADKTEAAYRRGDLFEKRRALMTAWANFLDPPTGSVVPLPVRQSA